MENNKNRRPVWKKNTVSHEAAHTIKFCIGRDVFSLPPCDNELILYDLWTNCAHARMLLHSEIINQNEWHDIWNGLQQIAELAKNENFPLLEDKEDVHMNVEYFLKEELGITAAAKIHTARSRNDQVATDIRLYIRHNILELCFDLSQLIRTIHIHSKEHLQTVMPGFTHYQPAMCTTWAHWTSSWSQALIRSIERFVRELQLWNHSPLGSAASFGTSWPIDRDFSSQLLGFKSVQENTIDSIVSSAERSAQVISSLSLLANQMSTIAQDIILLSQPYFNMISIKEDYTTGSSIMPQKRNPDFAEVIRAKASLCHGHLMAVLGNAKGLPSGYNRDTQFCKYHVIDTFREIMPIAKVLQNVINNITVHKQKMEKACLEDYIYSTDIADKLSQIFPISFRESYYLTAKTIEQARKENAPSIKEKHLQKAVKELKMNEIITDAEIKKVVTSMNPLACVESKTHKGAPSSISVTAGFINQENKLSALCRELEDIRLTAASSFKECFSTDCVPEKIIGKSFL